MRAFNKILLFGMVLTPLIFTGSTFACFTNTFAYFSDVEYSTGNTITAGVWDSEADHLIVSDSKLTGNGEKLHGITLDISGTQSVTIDKIQVWWDISLGDASLTEIEIHGKEFFSGSKSAGEIVDVENYLLKAGSPAKLELYFDRDVSDLAPFTINIIMGDGSVKSFVTDPKYRSDVPKTSAENPEGSQDEQEAPVTDTEDGQEQEASTIDVEEIREEETRERDNLDGQEVPVNLDGQEAPVTDIEESQEQEVSTSITSKGESQDIPETSTVDTEEKEAGLTGNSPG